MKKDPNFDKKTSNVDLKDVIVENLDETPVRNNTPSTYPNSETPGQKTDFSSLNPDLKSAENPPKSAVEKCIESIVGQPNPKIGKLSRGHLPQKCGKRRKRQTNYETEMSKMRPINSYFIKKTQILNEKIIGERNPLEQQLQQNVNFEEKSLLDGTTKPALAGGT